MSKINQNQNNVNTLLEENTIKSFVENILNFPYCANLDYYPHRQPKTKALAYPLIQPNHYNSQGTLCFDIDYPVPPYVWKYLDFPPPSLVSYNDTSGHCHASYILETPIHKNKNSSSQIMSWGYKLQRAITRAIYADESYNANLVKNPLSEKWQTYILHKDCYTLTELSNGFDLKNFQWEKKSEKVFGLGRNCDTFNSVRKIAYHDWRALFNYAYDTQFLNHCVSLAIRHTNEKHAEPLMEKEASYIGKHIALWTIKHMTPAGFVLDQTQKSVIAVAVHSAKADERKIEFFKFYKENPNMKNSEYQEIFEVSKPCIQKWKQQYRAENEKTPKITL